MDKQTAIKILKDIVEIYKATYETNEQIHLEIPTTKDADKALELILSYF